MKVAAIVLGASGAGLLVFAVALGIWAGMPANPLTTLGILLGQASSVTKLVLLLLAIQAIVILIVAVPRLIKPERDGDRSLLTAFSFVPPGLGLAASLLAGLSVLIAMQQANTTNLTVIAPSLAEAMTPLALGLLVGALAATLRAAPPK
jgi:hypothetical protein